MSKVVVTCAITGSVHTPSLSPYLPSTPDEIAADAIRAYEAGAAVVHIHARDPLTRRPSAKVEHFKAIADKIKAKCDVIMCFTTGGAVGMSTAERAAVVTTLKPELGSFTPGSMNFAFFGLAAKPREWKYDWEEPYIKGTEDMVFYNTFKVIKEYGRYFGEAQTKPEYEIFDIGMMNNLAFMFQSGALKKAPIYMQFVLGILGGMPADPECIFTLLTEGRRLLGDFQWSVCAAGRQQMALMATAIAMGGNVRVGLEDNLFLEKGVIAKSNAEPVEKVIRIARELGREPATPAEARAILGLKGIENVGF